MKISDFREKSIRFDTTQHTTKKQCDEKSLTVSFFVKKQSRKPKPKFRTTSFSQEEKRKQNSSRCWF